MSASGPVRVIVVDDHPVFRDGLAGAIGGLVGMEVVACASNGSEAVDRVDELAPDVVVMDLHMPVLSGTEATRLITARHPDTAVLVLTMLDDDASLFAALDAGARGYLLKEATPDEIERAIRSVVVRGAVFGASVAERILAALPSRAPARTRPSRPFPLLTERESEILELVARGLTNPGIADRLFLSEKTVRNYVSSILSKLGVEDRAAAVAVARDAGIGARD